MPEIKYAVCPGYIISPRDGDRHYITFRMLIKLHGVLESECVDRTRSPHGRHNLDSLIQLYPRANGFYPQYSHSPYEVGREMGVQFATRGGIAPECPYSDFLDVATWRMGWEEATEVIRELLVKQA